MNARTAAYAFAFVVLLGASVGMNAAIRAYSIYLEKLPIYAQRGVDALPTETASWRRIGGDQKLSAEMVEELDTDNYLSRRYVSKSDDDLIIDVHLAYYTNMIDTVPHVPERCMVGGGMLMTGGPFFEDVPLDSRFWAIDPALPEDYPGVVYEAPLPARWSTTPGVRRVGLPRDVTPEQPLSMRITSYEGSDGTTILAGYFFVANGGVVASAEGVRELAFDLTSDYAYYLKIQFTSASVDSPEALAEAAGSLLDDLFPEIMLCVPDWVAVHRGDYPEDNPRGQDVAG